MVKKESEYTRNKYKKEYGSKWNKWQMLLNQILDISIT
jgi:hypothetical protein